MALKINEWHSYYALGSFKGFMQQAFCYSYKLLIHSLFIYLPNYLLLSMPVSTYQLWSLHVCKSLKSQERAMEPLEMES